MSSGETDSAWHRGRLTLPQALGITVLAIAHFFDYATFVMLVQRHTLTAEANPVVVSIFRQTGIGGLTIAKIFTVVLAASMTVIIWPRYPRLAALLLTFGVVAGLFGALSNVASF